MIEKLAIFAFLHPVAAAVAATGAVVGGVYTVKAASKGLSALEDIVEDHRAAKAENTKWIADMHVLLNEKVDGPPVVKPVVIAPQAKKPNFVAPILPGDSK